MMNPMSAEASKNGLKMKKVRDCAPAPSQELAGYRGRTETTIPHRVHSVFQNLQNPYFSQSHLKQRYKIL